jgi:protein-tyrosine phosphatase
MPPRYRITTVCTGNICRSPMAQVVLQDRLASAGLANVVEVVSRGTSAEEFGNPIDRRAQQILAERGYEVPDHNALPATLADLADSQLVLAMTWSHARSLRRLAHGDEELAERIHMYRSFDADFAPGRSDFELDIEDPWYGGREDFIICMDQIEAAADGIVDYVRKQLGRA